MSARLSAAGYGVGDRVATLTGNSAGLCRRELARFNVPVAVHFTDGVR